MAKTDPNTWIAPNWHKDWKDVPLELDALKVLSIAILESFTNSTVELDLFEEGYLKVDVFRAGDKYAELYANVVGKNLEYALYVPIDKAEEEEHHFVEIADGIDILRRFL